MGAEHGLSMAPSENPFDEDYEDTSQESNFKMKERKKEKVKKIKRKKDRNLVDVAPFHRAQYLKSKT
jgi:hypothetical protein